MNIKPFKKEFKSRSDFDQNGFFLSIWLLFTFWSDDCKVKLIENKSMK